MCSSHYFYSRFHCQVPKSTVSSSLSSCILFHFYFYSINVSISSQIHFHTGARHPAPNFYDWGQKIKVGTQGRMTLPKRIVNDKCNCINKQISRLGEGGSLLCDQLLHFLLFGIESRVTGNWVLSVPQITSRCQPSLRIETWFKIK